MQNLVSEIRQWLDSKRSYDAGVKLYTKYGNDKLLNALFRESYSDFKWQTLQAALSDLAHPPAARPRNDQPAAPISQASAAKAPAVDTSAISVVKEEIAELRDNTSELDYRVADVEDTLYDQRRIMDKVEGDIEKLKQLQKSAPRGWPARMDEVVQSLHSRWLPLFVEKKNLQARVYDIALAGQKDPAKKEEAKTMSLRILELRDAAREIYKTRDYYLQHQQLPEEPKLIDIPEDPKRWPLLLQNFQRYARDYKNKLKSAPATEENKEKIEGYNKQLAKYEWGIAELKKLLGI